MKSKLKFLKNMNCPDQAKCLEVLELMLDGEATAEQKKQFELQIKNCMPCYKQYNLDKAIKEMLLDKVEVKEVPVGLVDNIRTKIRSEL